MACLHVVGTRLSTQCPPQAFCLLATCHLLAFLVTHPLSRGALQPLTSTVSETGSSAALTSIFHFLSSPVFTFGSHAPSQLNPTTHLLSTCTHTAEHGWSRNELTSLQIHSLRSQMGPVTAQSCSWPRSLSGHFPVLPNKCPIISPLCTSFTAPILTASCFVQKIVPIRKKSLIWPYGNPATHPYLHPFSASLRPDR